MHKHIKQGNTWYLSFFWERLVRIFDDTPSLSLILSANFNIGMENHHLRYGGFQLVMGVPQARCLVFVNGKIPSFEMDDWG